MIKNSILNLILSKKPSGFFNKNYCYYKEIFRLNDYNGQMILEINGNKLNSLIDIQNRVVNYSEEIYYDGFFDKYDHMIKKDNYLIKNIPKEIILLIKENY